MVEGPAEPLDETNPPNPPPDSKPVLAAAVATIGMVVFALASHTSFPVFSLAIGGLIVTTLAIGSSLRTGVSLGHLLGVTQVTRPVLLWCGAGLCLGAGLAFLFRFSFGQPLVLTGLQPFVFTAAAIGAAEELLFRGFVQGRLNRLGWPAAVALAALAHTTYKTSLFVFPREGWIVSFSILAFFTFLAGSIMGLTRQLSASVYPPLTAHVLFDILVYGGWADAPWWVWG